MIIQLCEIFTIGGIPISDNVRKVCLNAHALQRLSHAQMIKLTASDALQGFTAIHLGAIAATAWILLLNAIVGFQLLDDGTPVSVGLLLASGAILFIGTGYIALDTGFRWTGHFDPSLNGENRNIGLYVLYLLFPLICLVTFFALEAVLVLRILGELRPLCMLTPFSYAIAFVRLETVSSPIADRVFFLLSQYTSAQPVCFLPLVKFSNSSSVPTFVKHPMGR